MLKPYKARFNIGEWTPVAIAGEAIDGRTITREFLYRLVENYKPEENGIKAKIKIGHSNPLLPEAKAYGYFGELRVSPDNPDIIEGKPEWVHKELTEKLEKGEYRDISPEFKPMLSKTGKTDEEGNNIYEIDYFFSGVAVLGESQPAFPVLSLNYSIADNQEEIKAPERINGLNNIKLPELTYKSEIIKVEPEGVIEENNEENNEENAIKPNLDHIKDINIEIEKLKQEYKTLQQKYKELKKDKETEKFNYINTLKELNSNMEELKKSEKQQYIIDFCNDMLAKGKLMSYELMKDSPDEDIKDSGLVKHLSELTDEQLNFQLKLIRMRSNQSLNDEIPHTQAIVNTDKRNANTLNFYDYTDETHIDNLEEKKFQEFCTENNYKLSNINEIDKAYKEWRKYVKH